jgi:hypothetical protein
MERLGQYLAAGTQLVWVVYPTQRLVFDYPSITLENERVAVAVPLPFLLAIRLSGRVCGTGAEIAPASLDRATRLGIAAISDVWLENGNADSARVDRGQHMIVAQDESKDV